MFTFPILILAWIADDGPKRFPQLVKEPLVKGVLVFCVALLIGLLWSDNPQTGQMEWLKYFVLLIFIPFLSLLNKNRLPWVIGALLTGYFSVLLVGSYQQMILLEQGIPLLKISYLSFSAQLGIGVILAIYFASVSSTMKVEILFWFLALILLFFQFNQNARGLLFATLITILAMILLLYRERIRKFMAILLSLVIAISVFAFNSPVFQERFSQIKRDVWLFQQGNYSTSVGYRLAMWDVGLDGIAKQPLFGHGTGMPESYFENTIVTYKGGIYKNLPKFHDTSHYHNDWIEIGMHIGIMGMLALAFLLRNWYQTFKLHHLPVLGIALISYIFLAGLTDAFIIYSRIPTLLLVITAVTICSQKQSPFSHNKNTDAPIGGLK